jgi:small subunit ribosomal protein S4
LARYTDSVCRLCRREGTKLFLKGSRCETDKCAVEKRGYPPGQHGRLRRKDKGYGVQLREKQKVKRIYGILEKQFRNYFEDASRRTGVTGEALLTNLERRLDNVVYVSGFGTSRGHARQMVLHGHVFVNGRCVSAPGQQVKEGDVVSLKEKSRKNVFVKEAMSLRRTAPSWLELQREEGTAVVKRLPTRTDVTFPITEQHIVELYSR